MVSPIRKTLNDQLNIFLAKPLHTVLNEVTFSPHGIIYSTFVPFDSVVFTLLAPIRMPQEHPK